ncbi:hypothetical protein ADINL_2398 [Nitrincola lacisaponensis]|uniref:Transmembrane protein n=1 Tax=Nitrincola lacisaponensis TaxID=267850 RepID=A0A063Y0P5_9GAMM|nr:hypothetical protein [Nitrincola lacisaponensis]KDE39269.1 hypothetical protein ADINL_2398 [Nitrincola lacisaponensis]
MKIDQELYPAPEDAGAAGPRWIENPNPEFAGLWVGIKKFLGIFLVLHSIPLLLNLNLGLTHPLTLFNIALAVIFPTIILGSAFLQSQRPEPDDLYLSNLGTWILRLCFAFIANIALVVSIAFDIFPFIFSALLIACVVIELMAYLTYRSYSDDMIREIIEERKMFSPVNENNEFWFLNRGGDVGSDRLFIKGKWHLRLLYVLAYIAPFGVLSGGKAIGAYLAAFAAIAIYFMAHGLFTGYYVTRRGLQMRLEGKL